MGASLHQGITISQAQIPTEFPTTRYQGSKSKLVDWIWSQLADIEFHTCLDAFGGTGVVAHHLKRMGKCVTYNDALTFNTLIAHGLIENEAEHLSEADIEWLLSQHESIIYPHFVRDTFDGIYFTTDENAWIDQTITNIRALTPSVAGWSYRQSLAFFALCQACISKRPYNLFHRRNLYLRFAPVARSFGNKTSWDRPFDDAFRRYAAEANRAVFSNGQSHHALCGDALDAPGNYDLVYIDPPYVPERGQAVDYRGFYHFLEGLAQYDAWADTVDLTSKHRRLRPQPSPWIDRRCVAAEFDRLFQRFRDSTLVVSYRSDGVPNEAELTALLGRYKRSVRVAHYGRYQYALSTNGRSGEMLLMGV